MKISLGWLLFAFIGFVSCSPKPLSYLNEKGVPLQHFQTYRLLNTKVERTNLSKDGREILSILEESIREKMAERGYEESNLEPDLILRYEITTNQQMETSTSAGPFGPPVTSRTYMESLIIVDLMDASKRKMFWQSSFDLRKQTKDLRQEQATEFAVSEIFYSYPYRAGSAKPDPSLSDWKSGRKKLKAKHRAEKKAEKELEKQRKKER